MVSTSPSEDKDAEEETWQQMAKRRKVERQQEVVNLNSVCIGNIEFSATGAKWSSEYHRTGGAC